MDGGDWLHAAAVNLVNQALPEKILLPAPRHSSPQSCACPEETKRWWDLTHKKWGAADVLFANPLRMLHRMQPDSITHHLICYRCKKRIAKLLNAAREYMWDELPYAFGVKPREQEVKYGWQPYLCVLSFSSYVHANAELIQR